MAHSTTIRKTTQNVPNKNGQGTITSYIKSAVVEKAQPIVKSTLVKQNDHMKEYVEASKKLKRKRHRVIEDESEDEVDIPSVNVTEPEEDEFDTLEFDDMLADKKQINGKPVCIKIGCTNPIPPNRSVYCSPNCYRLNHTRSKQELKKKRADKHLCIRCEEFKPKEGCRCCERCNFQNVMYKPRWNGVTTDQRNKIALALSQSKYRPIDLNGQPIPADSVELDHGIPLFLGGSDELQNMTVLHKLDNRSCWCFDKEDVAVMYGRIARLANVSSESPIRQVPLTSEEEQAFKGLEAVMNKIPHINRDASKGPEDCSAKQRVEYDRFARNGFIDPIVLYKCEKYTNFCHNFPQGHQQRNDNDFYLGYSILNQITAMHSVQQLRATAAVRQTNLQKLIDQSRETKEGAMLFCYPGTTEVVAISIMTYVNFVMEKSEDDQSLFAPDGDGTDRRVWTAEESLLLFEGVAKYGFHAYLVADHIGTRDVIQVRAKLYHSDIALIAKDSGIEREPEYVAKNTKEEWTFDEKTYLCLLYNERMAKYNATNKGRKRQRLGKHDWKPIANLVGHDKERCRSMWKVLRREKYWP
jgi:hypothetical protein